MAAVGSTGSTGQNSAMVGATHATTGDNSLGKDTFLKLMVAQLKYQDPLKPTDSAAFLAQTAQFTQVEKLDQLTQTMTDNAKLVNFSTASALLGRTVTFTGADKAVHTGQVTKVLPTADGVNLKVGTYDTTLADLTEVTATTSTTA